MAQGDSSNSVKSKTKVFGCSACGGDMVFDPKDQALSCLYCGNKVDVEDIDGEIEEYDINSVNEYEDANWSEETRVIHCEDCGAENVLKREAIAEFCPFCGSSHVVNQQELPGIKPNSLIPFKVPLKRANELFSSWIKGKFFAPKQVKQSHKLDKIKGVYIPYWTYDTDTYSNYTAQRGTYYYVTERDVVYENGERKVVERRVRKTRWDFVSGSHDKYFDDVLVNASSHLPAKIIKKLEPFNLEELVHYQPEYLSGFSAERYTLGLDEGWHEAKRDIESSIYTDVVRKIGGDTVRNVNINTSYNDIRFKHILLPIWMSSYKYNDKVYRFMINGQTGEVQGEVPVSPLKVTLTVLISIAVIVGGYFLTKYFL